MVCEVGPAQPCPGCRGDTRSCVGRLDGGVCRRYEPKPSPPPVSSVPGRPRTSPPAATWASSLAGFPITNPGADMSGGGAPSSRSGTRRDLGGGARPDRRRCGRVSGSSPSAQAAALRETPPGGRLGRRSLRQARRTREMRATAARRGIRASALKTPATGRYRTLSVLTPKRRMQLSCLNASESHSVPGLALTRSRNSSTPHHRYTFGRNSVSSVRRCTRCVDDQGSAFGRTEVALIPLGLMGATPSLTAAARSDESVERIRGREVCRGPEVSQPSPTSHSRFGYVMPVAVSWWKRVPSRLARTLACGTA